MVTQTRSRTMVQTSRTERVIYEERTALFGLITWWQRMSAERLGDDIIICTNNPEWEINRIYLDGKKIYEKEN